MSNVFSLLLLFFISLFSVWSNDLYSQCRLAGIIKDNKLKIESPYKYDGFNYLKIEFGPDKKIQKREFIAFKGQKYSLLFCTEGFDENVRIQIIDAADSTVIAGSYLGEKITTWKFAPERTGTFGIVYEIPPSNTEATHDACIVMLIGFKEQ